MSKTVTLLETKTIPSDMLSVFNLFLTDWLANVGGTSYNISNTAGRREFKLNFSSDEDVTMVVLQGLPSSLAKRVQIKLGDYHEIDQH